MVVVSVEVSVRPGWIAVLFPAIWNGERFRALDGVGRSRFCRRGGADVDGVDAEHRPDDRRDGVAPVRGPKHVHLHPVGQTSRPEREGDVSRLHGDGVARSRDWIPPWLLRCGPRGQPADRS